MTHPKEQKCCGQCQGLRDDIPGRGPISFCKNAACACHTKLCHSQPSEEGESLDEIVRDATSVTRNPMPKSELRARINGLLQLAYEKGRRDAHTTAPHTDIEGVVKKTMAAIIQTTLPADEEIPLIADIIRDAFTTLVEAAREDCKQAMREELRIGMLRQWLNEDRITDPKRMVTNEDIIYWLTPTDNQA